MQHLLEWHCSRGVGFIKEEYLLRLGHSLKTLTCCKKMMSRMESLFEDPSFNRWIAERVHVTPERASLLQSVCLASLGGDIRVMGLLRHLHARLDYTIVSRDLGSRATP